MDKKAVKLLSSYFWGPGGWKPEKDKNIDELDFAYAKSKGVMFDPVYLDHGTAVSKAIAAASRCSPRSVADAFVHSLSSRALHYRSALGSYAVLAYLEAHPFRPIGGKCATCGVYESQGKTAVDLNVLNFERMKWGGVRHGQVVYAAFDLEQFSRLQPYKPHREDVALLTDLLQAIAEAPSGITSGSLQAILPRALKSNKPERDVLIGILGLCGILSTRAHPGYKDEFVPYTDRSLPERRFVDMAYPACWWTGSDGLDQAAVTYWFGHLL